MSKKLSKKEREKVVTKGYLEDKDYVTKDYLDKKLDNYVTKDYLDIRLNELSKEFKDYVSALIEHQTHQLQTFYEGFDNRYVLRKEWEAAK